jgi:hypothetical protein
VNKTIDTIIATQLASFFACVFAYLAHLIENGTILNDNWMWAVWVLMGFSVLFWLAPYLVIKPKPELSRADYEHMLDNALREARNSHHVKPKDIVDVYRKVTRDLV